MHLEFQEQHTSTPTRSATLTTMATNALDPLVNNPSIGTALQVLESLANVGKALPFVAPAFVLLKIIIDLERRAQDVDVKCTDLLERITFMLSHLPSLQKIEITSSTQQVIERMNEALKDSASLIGAYRKQNRIARRLAIGNRERFTICAKTINNCSRDLLMSLQIHQSVKLDVLTRDVPIDDEDKAARSFVDEHGGSVDAVIHNRELVKEFATQQHMIMDDSVMEQLNANISELMQQNHTRLEGILRNNVSTAIVDGLKNMAMELYASEAEQKFICVQCEKEFTHYTNGPKACSFHRAEYEKGQFPCCSTSHPCQFNTHRSKHHCDYPYGNFFPCARKIVGWYSDTRIVWAKAEDTNLESNDDQEASVSELCRWVTGGAPVEENTLLVTVGKITYNTPYFFDTFTAKDLENISISARHSGRMLIFRTSQDENEFSMAEWILATSGEITGIRLVAKSATSDNPSIRVCPIDAKTCEKSGEILKLSEGGLQSYNPSSPYILPETVIIGPVIKDTTPRATRTDFKSVSDPSFKVIMKTVSDPPLEDDSGSYEADYFFGKVSVFNNNLPGSLNPVTIAAVSAQYRMVGDAEYLPVTKCTVLEGLEAPVTIEPRQSLLLSIKIAIARSEENSKLRYGWQDRRDRFITRHRPIRIKIFVEDVEGEKCSLVLEYVEPANSLTKQEPAKDLGFFFFDNPNILRRYALRVQRAERDDVVITIGGTDLFEERLAKVVYQASKTGETEIDLDISWPDDNFKWVAYALVDISCRRVYAFKIILIEGRKAPIKRAGCIGYVLCPDYGNIVPETTRPISYATEVARLPPMEPYTMLEYLQDDDIDDFMPAVPSKPTAVNEAPPSTVPTTVIPGFDDVRLELAAINTNLASIASSLEKLMRHFTT